MEMKEKKDLRVIKTKNLLYKSIVKLMSTKSFEEIKVADICTDALINRSTFYAHYSDKYELLLDLVKELKYNLLASLDKNEHIVNTKDYYLELIRLTIDHIDIKRDVYFSILMSNRSSIIVDIIIDVTVKDINNRLELGNIHKGNVPTDIFVKFYLGAVASIVVEWLRCNGKYSKEEIIDYLDVLIPEIN